ncbi:hypothetical protein [Streptomyces longispororuber]|uniref:hypothetical protein n=1 Tax=Streptomyces longispororuber TaxID=68230 RepID=UPI003701404B
MASRTPGYRSPKPRGSPGSTVHASDTAQPIRRHSARPLPTARAAASPAASTASTRRAAGNSSRPTGARRDTPVLG